MLPSSMTLIVPEAESSKRRRVELSGIVRWPISRLTLPRISRIGSSNRSAKRSSMPPERSMKKTRFGCGSDDEFSTGSMTWKDSVSAVPALPASSSQVPAWNATVAVPGTNCPVR